MKINVAVFFGGKSVEHEISVISAIQAAHALDAERYNPVPVYISKSNEMYSGGDMLKIEAYSELESLLKRSHRVTIAPLGGKTYIWRTDGRKLFKQKRISIDVALPIVHGVNVEDGTLAGFIQLMNLPYVGCDVCSSALGMNKYISKKLFEQVGLPVLPCEPLTEHEYYANENESVERVEAAIGYPSVVKPVNLGSSVGISLVKTRGELKDALELAFNLSESVIVERAVTAIKEVNCSVLGGGGAARASECEEPMGSDEILSYKDKYMSGGSKKTAGVQSAGSKGMQSLERKLPADIDADTRAKIQDMAVKAFNALDCSGVARIDFIIDKSTNDIWLNEINTIPGSLSFYLWEYSGMNYTQLLNELIAIALKRERMQSRRVYSFETNVLKQNAVRGVKS